MKGILLIVSLMALPVIACTQAQSIQRFYDKYKALENVSEVKLQGWLLEVAASFTDEATAESLLRKISQLRILVMEDGNLITEKEHRRLLRDVKKERFEAIMEIREGGEHIEFLLREDKNTITDVLILVSGDDEFVLLSLEGALRFEDLNDLQIDINGAEHFRKIPETKREIPRA